MRIGFHAAQTLEDIFAKFTNRPEGFDFSKTWIPLQLAQHDDDALLSRSQAKRIVAGLEKFCEVWIFTMYRS
jgi:hypothetical protein